MNKNLRFFLGAIPALLCMILIFYFSSQTAADSSETSKTFIQEILTQVFPEFVEESPQEQKNRVETLQFFVRKTAHFSLYALLSLLLLFAFLQLFSPFTKRFSLLFYAARCMRSAMKSIKALFRDAAVSCGIFVSILLGHSPHSVL